MAVSGNTVMAHLLLGINPRNMGAVPFQPGTNFPGSFRANELGIEINPAGPVDIVPSISAYVGGDIVSDIYICGIHQTDKPAMVIDIGTNGEIALGFDGQIWACATPAGPAYEGGGITCGMRATIGAIEKIRINRADLSVEYETIGNVKPAGICGSGLIDFLAEARKSGLIDNAGRFDKRLVNAVVEMISEDWLPMPFPTWLTFVPSVKAPCLVRDFARRLAKKLRLKFIDCVAKKKENQPQKIMQNSFQQAHNLDGVFEIDEGKILNEPLFLVDDMVDSRWTITIISALLRRAGSGEIFPLALAMTTSK